MKTKYMTVMAAVMMALPSAAQETYENAKIAAQDLNGTARYVGMGGAVDALGADLSTISTNPAGIGLFRHSKVEGTLGMVSQQGAADYKHGDATNLSFDQVGFVWSSENSNGNSFFNVAFNYHKSRNFNYILSADDRLNGASQNKLSYMKLANNLTYPIDMDGNINYTRPYISCNQLDDIYTRNLFGAAGDGNLYYYDATSYDLDRAHEGYIGEYDINFSGNINDRVYLGLTLGVEDVHYSHTADYTENMVSNPENINQLNVYDERSIKGTGVSLKLGAIFRPIEYAPLLLGVNVSTPTWYDLKSSNYTEVSDGVTTIHNGESYEYKMFTPWKFGINAGYTIDQKVAIGAGFEFADYGHIDNRINDTDYADYYYDYYDSSHSDENMNDHTKSTLKGVSTFKVGVEVKPIPEIALRAGYNYVSPMYKENSFKDGTINSYGSYYSSATDYTNWKATNRFTCGIGFKFSPNTNLDLAYQYSATSGNFSPFMQYIDNEFPDWDIKTNELKIDNKRHQILCTLGYTF